MEKKRIQKETFGFISSPDDLKKVIAENPNYKLLVRCGGGRFVVNADQADHFMEIIRKEGSDYVRDLSFLAE